MRQEVKGASPGFHEEKQHEGWFIPNLQFILLRRFHCKKWCDRQVCADSTKENTGSVEAIFNEHIRLCMPINASRRWKVDNETLYGKGQEGTLERELKKEMTYKKGEPMQEEKNISIDIIKLQVVKDGSIEYGKKAIRNPEELAELGLKFLKNADREMFILVCLNTKNFVNCIHLVAIGTLDRVVISAREVLKTALLANAASIAFVHNHPSGDAEPSQEDIRITRTLASCADLFDIRVLDHVIVADDGHYESLLEKKILEPDSSSIYKQPAFPDDRVICHTCY